MRKITPAPGQLLRSVKVEKSYHCKADYPPLKVAPGQQKTHVNSNRRQTVDRGKVKPWVKQFPGFM